MGQVGPQLGTPLVIDRGSQRRAPFASASQRPSDTGAYPRIRVSEGPREGRLGVRIAASAESERGVAAQAVASGPSHRRSGPVPVPVLQAELQEAEQLVFLERGVEPQVRVLRPPRPCFVNGQTSMHTSQPKSHSLCAERRGGGTGPRSSMLV